MNRSPLKRRTPLRARRRPRVTQPGEAEWKMPRRGLCAACGFDSERLDHHHCLYKQVVVREGGDPWDAANGIYVCRRCHSNHHSASRRIPIGCVPAAAIAFADNLLGEDRASLFFEREYRSAES